MNINLAMTEKEALLFDRCEFPVKRKPWRPSLLQVLLVLLLSWASVTYTLYLADVPGLGGSDEFCDSFFIQPDSQDPVYPYKNTFNISRPIDWAKSGQADSLEKYRIIGTHNSYHIQQYEGSPTWFASWWTRWVREWQYQ